MKIKVNKFLEHGVAAFAGVASSIVLTGLSQHVELIAPATDVLYSSNASFGVGIIGAMLGVVATRLYLDHLKANQTEDSTLQFVSNKPRMR